MTKVFIGGMSQSGKTTLSMKLSNLTGFNHIYLDRNSDIAATRDDRPRQIYFARKAIEDAPCNSIIEGSHLWPKHIEPSQIGALTIAFCGYPDATADAKAAQLRAQNFLNADHLRSLDEDGLISRLNEYIAFSQKIAEQARLSDIPFFNFSDLDSIESDMNSAVEEILKLLGPAILQ